MTTKDDASPLNGSFGWAGALWPWVFFALALLLRFSVLDLPLEGDGALLATRAERMGREESFDLEGIGHRGPLLPMLLAVPITSGATPTAALRWLDVLLGALVAPLAAGLARRFGFGARVTWWTGVLVALHPLLAVGMGGPIAGTASLVLVLLLTSLRLLTSPGSRRRRLGCLVAFLLPLADPLAVVYVPGLVWAFVRREASPRARLLLGALAPAVLLLLMLTIPLPALGDGAPSFGGRLLAFLPWTAAAGLLVLVPFVGRGLARTWRVRGRGRDTARACLVGAGLNVLLLLALPLERGFAFDPCSAGAAAPAALFLLLAGIAGLGRRSGPGPRRWRRVAVGLAVVGSLFVISGPVQILVFPRDPPATGRRYRLGRAMEETVCAAGEGGWVAIDLARDLTPIEEVRLADLALPHTVGRLPPFGEDRETGGGLAPLPLGDLPAGGVVGILTRYRPEVLGVTTLGGSGIYVQEPVARRGPWLVLRASRP